MKKIEFQVETKEIEPRVYAIMFIHKGKPNKHLKIVAEYTLTDAYDKGRSELLEDGFAQSEDQIAIEMWAELSVEKVIEKVCSEDNQTLDEILHNDSIKIDKDELEMHTTLNNMKRNEILIWAWQEYQLELPLAQTKEDQVQEFWEAYEFLGQNRDKLMKQLIRLGDEEKLDQCKDYLEPHEYKYVKRQITI